MFIKNILFTKHETNHNKQTTPAVLNFSNPVLQTLSCDTISFKGIKELTPKQKFERAKDIVDCFTKDQIQNMDDFDQSHLEGLQYGLKTFEGMKFKDIYFLLSHTQGYTIPLHRDCAGRCAACNVNGRPKEHNKENILERMDFDDYKNLTDDLKEITTRLNFNCRKKGMQNSQSMFEYPVNALFYDSDSKDTWLKDKDGNVHEFPELNKMLYDATGIHGLFDTAGWSPTNTKVQKRVERMVEYYKEPKHRKEIEQINVSFNTYNGLLAKANDFLAKGDFEGYERLRNQYIKNVANAMYTMTPLLDSRIYQVFLKCVEDNENSEFDPYKIETLEELIQETLCALRERYAQDLSNGGSEFVHKKSDIETLIDKHINCFSPILTGISPNFENKLFSKIENSDYFYIKDEENTDFNDAIDITHGVLIDINGKVYLSNDNEVFETDLQLNFKNKDKESKQIYPIPDKRKLHIQEKTFK